MKFIELKLEGAFLIQPDFHGDDRGFFMETYHLKKYREKKISVGFVQDNFSHSRKNTLRGLHYQLRHPQDKLIYVINGSIFDVIVDIRKGSRTFGAWYGVELSSDNKHQLFIPKGFAHGFCVLSNTADVVYKCSDFYVPDDDFGIIWSDPEIRVSWPVSKPFLSLKDRDNPSLKQISDQQLPKI